MDRLQRHGQSHRDGHDDLAGRPDWRERKYKAECFDSIAVACPAILAPTANAATDVTSNSFTANWSSVSTAVGYQLDVSTNNAFSSYVSGYQNLNVGNVVSWSVTGLSQATTYYYRVRAYNGALGSDNSGAISVTTIIPGSPPPAPAANAATGVTNTAFTANWSSASGATGYQLDVSTNNTFSNYVSGYQNLDVGNVLSSSVTGLSPVTTYYYRVRAYNGVGASGNSGTISVTTTPSPPSAPTANAATGVASNSFTANWSSASGATGYQLDVSTDNAFGSYQSGYQNLDVGNVLSWSVTGLSPVTTYYYRVRAYNGGGASDDSGTISVTTTSTVIPCVGIVNADFKDGNTGGVANGWTGYQRIPDPDTTTWSIQTASPPPGGGLQYQQIANASLSGAGGVRQDVTGCVIGGTYTISGWMRGNSIADATCTVKVSPTASTDWTTAIDLTPPQTYTGDTWTPFSGTVKAAGTAMTIWLEGQTGGTGELKAECFDSITVACTHIPASLRFESVTWLAQNQVLLVLSGEPGNSVTLLWSSNLVDWTALTNLTNTAGTLEVTDTPASNVPQRFYRASTP